MRTKVDDALTLALYALKEEATWQWKKGMEGEAIDLSSLQRSWNQVIHEVMILDQKKEKTK